MLSYTIMIFLEVTSYTLFKNVLSNQTAVVINGLDPDFTYQVKVWANTSAGAGKASEVILVESLPMTGMMLS